MAISDVNKQIKAFQEFCLFLAENNNDSSAVGNYIENHKAVLCAHNACFTFFEMLEVKTESDLFKNMQTAYGWPRLLRGPGVFLDIQLQTRALCYLINQDPEFDSKALSTNAESKTLLQLSACYAVRIEKEMLHRQRIDTAVVLDSWRNFFQSAFDIVAEILRKSKRCVNTVSVQADKWNRFHKHNALTPPFDSKVLASLRDAGAKVPHFF